MTTKEIIEALTILKDSSVKSHNDTGILEVKQDTFNFVIDQAIKALNDNNENKFY